MSQNPDQSQASPNGYQPDQREEHIAELKSCLSEVLTVIHSAMDPKRPGVDIRPGLLPRCDRAIARKV